MSVELRNKITYGIVIGAARTPSFTTKPVLHALGTPPIPAKTLQLAEWLKAYYASPIGTITSLLLPRVLPKLPIGSTAESPQELRVIDTLPELTAEQNAALATMSEPDTYILYGRTGSGKTRIYIELAIRALRAGKSVMILTPEIGLISHMGEAFNALFHERVILIHSRQSTKTRAINWLKILCATSPQIIIGPRSALFSPVRDLGLIVLDESHDQSYKQEQTPRYNAVTVAAQLRNLHNAMCILGSATPAIVDYYIAVHKHKPIVRLERLAKESIFHNKHIVVDMTKRDLFLRSPHLSVPLLDSMAVSIARNEQVLLYLNRRGTARVTSCGNCGWSALCPHCDIPLIYHGDLYRLACHICGYKQAPPLACPSCGHPSLLFKSFGTKAIVDEVARLFPEARIMRFDGDNTQAERFENSYDKIISGDVDIIVGTQTIAKGLDLPRLSTLGVILADTSLFTPDFTSQERTYQLVNQVIGRIGRGHLAGTAVVQTYQPKSDLINAAISGDWEDFYRNEIAARERYNFPPFCHLLKLTVSRKTERGAHKAAIALYDAIAAKQRLVEVVGPAPAFHYKVSGTFRWQLVVKARQRRSLLALIQELPGKGWSFDIDPVDLL